MDNFSENYIKQENNSMENEFISLIPLKFNIEPDIPIKTEPVFNEPETLVAVKKEIVTDDCQQNTIQTLDSNGIHNTSNANNQWKNGFVIYEYEENVQSTALSPPHLLNVNSKNKTAKQHPTLPQTQPVAVLKRSLGTMLKEALASTSTLTQPIILNTKAKIKTNEILNRESEPSLSEKITSIKPTTPPTLLNTQLRKRSSCTGKPNENAILSVKKICNINQLLTEDRPLILNVEKSPKTYTDKKQKSKLNDIQDVPHNTNRKVINYAMRKKKYRGVTGNAIKESETLLSSSPVNEPVTSSPSVTTNTNEQQKLPAIDKNERILDDQDINKNTIKTPTTITLEEIKNSHLSSSLRIPTKPSNTFEIIPTKENSMEAVVINDSNTKEHESILSVCPSSPLPVVPITTSDFETPTTSSKPRKEIKVKCLCRLTGENTSDDQPIISKAENLKDFFHQMFQETRKLNKQQQRTVKMTLLQAICEAEEMVEKGKCCCF